MKEEVPATEQEGQGSAKAPSAAAPPTPTLPTVRLTTGIDSTSSGASTRKEDTPADDRSTKRTPQESIEEKTKQSTTGAASIAGATFRELPASDADTRTDSWCCPWCGFKNFSVCPVCEVCGETIYPEEHLVENKGPEATAKEVDSKLPAMDIGGNDVQQGALNPPPATMSSERRTPVQVHLTVVADVEELTAHDILLAAEHGREFQHYAGNMKLATLIRGACYLYRSATYKKRAEMIPAVVQQIKRGDPAGRFLKLEPETTEWVEVPDDYANLHVLQLFLRSMAQQEKDRFVPPVGDSCQEIRVWNIQDASVPKEAYEDSSGRKANMLKPAPTQMGTQAGYTANEDDCASVQSDCAIMDRLVADEIANDLCEAWGRHDVIWQAMADPLDRAASTDDGMDDRRGALASLRAAAVSLEADDIAADGLLKTDTKSEDSSRLKTLQQMTTGNLKAAAASLDYEPWPEQLSPSGVKRDMFTDSLKAATGSLENDDHLIVLKTRHEESSLFPQPSASDCHVSKDEVSDGPPNESGWQNGKPQPNHGCDIVNRIIWQLRWGTESDASRYYVVNRCLIPDTGKEEILRHAIQHVDRTLIPALFPGLPFSATSYDERTAVQTKPCVGNPITNNVVRSSAGNNSLRHAPAVWCGIGGPNARTITTHPLRRPPRNPLQTAVGFDRAPDATGAENPQFDAATSETSAEAIAKYRADNCNDEKALERAKEIEECSRLLKLRGHYDGAVVDVAMYNYECFYELKRGSASFGAVAETSAGIEGWAACTIPEDSPRPKRADFSVDVSERKCASKTQEPKRRRDPEEDRQLQIALLESVGAFPNRLKVAGYECPSDSSCSEGEWSDYQYEDDEEEEESQECEDRQESSDEESEEAQKEDGGAYNVPITSATLCCDLQEPAKDTQELALHQARGPIDITQAREPLPVYAPDDSVDMNTDDQRAAHLVGLRSHETEGAQQELTPNSDSDSWSNVSSAVSDSSGSLVERGDVREVSCEPSRSDEKFHGVERVTQEEVVLDCEVEVDDDWSDVSNTESAQTKS